MKRFTKTLALAVTGFGFVLSAADAQACGGRGGGGGYYPAAYRPAYSNYNYCPQTYPQAQPYPYAQQQQPYYAQQQQPYYAQQPVQQPGMSVQVHRQQPAQQVATASAMGALGGQPVQGGQFAQQGGQFAQQGGQFAQQGGQVPQANAQFPQQGQQVAQQTNVGGQQNVQQNVQAAPQAGQAAARNVAVAPQNVTSAPAAPVQTAAPVQNAAPVQTPVQNQPQPSGNSAELNALEALAGFGGEVPAAAAQQQVASAPQAMPTTGEFVATVKEGATVRLSLNADGSFRWTATASGKTSNFEGTFVLQNGSLQLVRADNQKLEGSVTQIDGGFNLRLSGQTDSGLNFVRG